MRSKDYPLTEHYHGKGRVRVLRVRRNVSGGYDTVQEYSVNTRLFSPTYQRVFTKEDNTDVVATDTQKNTCYVIAKRSKATTPEGFGIDVAQHLLTEYPILTAVEVDVTEELWRRYQSTTGEPHEHGYLREAPEKAYAKIRLTREDMAHPSVTSGLTGLTVLKTTQSGFADYLRDQYTLLPPTQERCLATEMSVEWTYAPKCDVVTADFGGIRSALRSELLRGFFGPVKGGVYSHSLQATIYDAGCLVLNLVSQVQTISIFTPNIHMIPFHQLKALNSGAFEDDVYVATSDPAGTIRCTVSR